jgi:pimeloyl-ACP methyl ester carboxylesterase
MASITAGDLEISYDEQGSADRGVVLLLHGWPDDASTWNGVAPALAATGRRTIMPTLRGFGDTRFSSGTAPRTGNSGILAMDAIALMDALRVERFSVVGHDWGSNIAEALAVGWPDRVERIALLSTPPRLGGMPTPPFRQAQRYWYHWFMATRRGAEAVRADPHGFAHIMWENWAPPGWFDEATFKKVARAFHNPDWVDVTLHSYRARWDNAEPDPRSAWLEEKVKATKTLSLPTIYIQGEADGVSPPYAFEQVPKKFTGPFEFIKLPGVGHFPQREASAKVSDILVRFFAETGTT